VLSCTVILNFFLTSFSAPHDASIPAPSWWRPLVVFSTWLLLLLLLLRETELIVGDYFAHLREVFLSCVQIFEISKRKIQNSSKRGKISKYWIKSINQNTAKISKYDQIFWYFEIWCKGFFPKDIILGLYELFRWVCMWDVNNVNVSPGSSTSPASDPGRETVFTD